MASIKVLGSVPSPYVNRVQIALNLKSVDYEFLQEQVGSKSELLLKSNPVHKKIPVLIHGEKPICQSLIIVQYIDEVWSDGPSILPSDPYDRAVARFWAAYLDDKWWPTIMVLRNAVGEEAQAPALEKVIEGLMPLEDAFAKCSKGKDFFGGDTIGYLDIAFGSFLGWISGIEVIANVKMLDETKTPGLFEWAKMFRSNAAVKDIIPKTEVFVKVIKKFAAGANAQ
ncbi:glutathione S-transferase U18-like [Rhododendron vialii]|uniref:glutathione S-transferase U18-like n=1 Tax=Rhododendron vialii TaxID=182163 RepID=UPI00265F98B2|nr:glutathione S-transferase U18-like [Rhododendron vialii]